MSSQKMIPGSRVRIRSNGQNGTLGNPSSYDDDDEQNYHITPDIGSGFIVPVSDITVISPPDALKLLKEKLYFEKDSHSETIEKIAEEILKQLRLTTPGSPALIFTMDVDDNFSLRRDTVRLVKEYLKIPPEEPYSIKIKLYSLPRKHVSVKVNVVS